MDDLEEALQNIDVFCKTVVRKMVEKGNETEDLTEVEPIENLVRRKQVEEESTSSIDKTVHLIPLPQIDEPLVDVFEDDDYFKVMMQCHCEHDRMTVLADIGGLEVCKRKCHKTEEGVEICVNECKRLDVPVNRLQLTNMVSRCNNNEILEIDIPKQK